MNKQDTVTANVNRRRELELAEAQKQIAELQAVVTRLAKGTREIAPEVLPLSARVEAFLREDTASIKKLARALNSSPEEVEGVLFELRKEGKIFNLGLETNPEWTLIVGEIPTQDLNALVARLITRRPMTVKELSAATGAKLTRVGGAIIAAQRTKHVLDLGTETRAGRYFIPEAARDARLPPKGAEADAGGD